ncbi:hypothetical protein JCM19046_1060 [Bacillus sp. JCM 19046]|nr:hypothetical protein JCM19045_2894 [Bacillus sp. JCM 19045]GAF16614.1 hypothetical protein JCM19046_1060 [Bacillus sp. JCM 19046]
MEALASLLVISLMGSVILPLFLWVYEHKQALQQEYQDLMTLEEKRYSFYLVENDHGWNHTENNHVMEYCLKSEVEQNEENCVYAFKK